MGDLRHVKATEDDFGRLRVTAICPKVDLKPFYNPFWLDKVEFACICFCFVLFFVFVFVCTIL